MRDSTFFLKDAQKDSEVPEIPPKGLHLAKMVNNSLIQNESLEKVLIIHDLTWHKFLPPISALKKGNGIRNQPTKTKKSKMSKAVMTTPI